VEKCNETLVDDSMKKVVFIGVLDIAGFEIFDVSIFSIFVDYKLINKSTFSIKYIPVDTLSTTASVPSSELGTPAPSPPSECVPPPPNQREGKTRLLMRGGGGPNSDDWKA
jgi:hypothetical protein